MLIGTSTQFALNAQRALYKAQQEMQVSSERLASGKRINRAADDAAGLAIATSLKTQELSTAAAVRNTVDAISVAQTLDASLSSVSSVLQRMRELSIHAMNGTLSTDQKSMLDKEFDQLKLELNSIASSSKFNGQALLDSSFDQSFQIGTEAGETVSLSMPAAFDSANLPPKDAQGEGINAVLGNFVNEAGETIAVTVEGISLSYTATGTADQTGNALALFNALNTDPVKTQLADKQISFRNLGSSVEIIRTSTATTPLTIQMGSASDAAKVNSLTVSNFDNLADDTVSFDLSGVSIEFTGKGTDQAANVLALEAALTAKSAALSERGISWTNNGNSITISQQDSVATTKIDELAINMLTGGGGESTFTVTSNYGLVNGSEAPGESRILTDGTQLKIDAFTNVLNETITTQINGYSFNFTAAGTADQAGNATAMAAAINARNIPNVSATAVAGVVHMNNGSGSALSINSMSGSDGDVSRFRVTAGDHSTTSGTGWVEEGAKITLSNFSNTVSGETISFRLAGKTVSFISAGDSNQTANATALKNALDSAGLPSYIQWKIDNTGNGVMITDARHMFLSFDDFTMTGVNIPSVQLTRGGDTAGTSTSNTVVISGEWRTDSIQNYVGTAGETISFDLSGVSISYLSAGSSADTTNSSNLKAALDTNSAALNALGYSWSLSGSQLLLTRSGANISITNFSGTSNSPLSMKLGSTTVAEGHSFYLQDFNYEENEAVSFAIAGVTVSYTASNASDQVANATALYNALAVPATTAALNAAGVYFEYDGSNRVRIIKTNNSSLTINNHSATDPASNGYMRMVGETNSNFGSQTFYEGQAISATASDDATSTISSSYGFGYAFADSDANSSYTSSSVERAAEVFEPADYMTITTDFSGGGTIGEGEQVEILDLGVISDIELDTTAGLAMSLRILDRSLNYIHSERAKVGAFQNRMEHVASNLHTMQVNISAARSRIEDADYAAESARLAKANILRQASMSILSQANQQQKMVLQLLKQTS